MLKISITSLKVKETVLKEALFVPVYQLKRILKLKNETTRKSRILKIFQVKQPNRNFILFMKLNFLFKVTRKV